MIPLKASPDMVPAGGAGAIPRHVAIIMDGNGRWAKARRLPRAAGHRRGVEAVRKVVRKAGELGVEVLTLYAFSSENWRRPAEEISDLMGLLRHFIRADINEIADAGVGSPYFTTDSGAALRAAEMKCDALFKGTSVDGVYDADPKKVASAKRFETISYDRVLADNLKVMDASAVALCRDNNIPIVVFNIREQGNLARVLSGEGTATIVQSEEDS